MLYFSVWNFHVAQHFQINVVRRPMRAGTYKYIGSERYIVDTMYRRYIASYLDISSYDAIFDIQKSNITSHDAMLDIHFKMTIYCNIQQTNFGPGIPMGRQFRVPSESQRRLGEPTFVQTEDFRDIPGLKCYSNQPKGKKCHLLYTISLI